MRTFPSHSFRALGTTATVVARDRRGLETAVDRVRRELARIDRACSRFRPDSDITRLNEAEGAWTRVDGLLIDAIGVALRAAQLTGGLVDPTVGAAMLWIGYDRNFDDLPIHGSPFAVADGPSSKGVWRRVELDRDRRRVRLPRGVHLDLGATAKALAADRSAARAALALGAGVLVSLGGDVSTAGMAPPAGWPVGIAEDHASVPEPGETIVIGSAGVTTSSTTVRRWSRGGELVHHIVDPRTGVPADVVWRTVSVCAGSCVDANIASTASIVMGDDAPGWLDSRGLPARLVRVDGAIERVGGWPVPAAA